jgi:hypothetical protein
MKHHAHAIGQLAHRAEKAMRRWARTLTPKQRKEIGERTRRERVHQEIKEERSRRTVSTTVAAAPKQGATTGPHYSANLSPKGETGMGGRKPSRS